MPRSASNRASWAVSTDDMVKSLKLRDTVPILLGAKLR
jgi:hypothetical protein